MVYKHIALTNIIAARTRVIDEDGKMIGIMARETALKLAMERDMDLIETVSKADLSMQDRQSWKAQV